MFVPVENELCVEADRLDPPLRSNGCNIGQDLTHRKKPPKLTFVDGVRAIVAILLVKVLVSHDVLRQVPVVASICILMSSHLCR